MNKKEILADLCRQFSLDILYVFGSRSGEALDWLEDRRERLPPGPSDVDVGVKPTPGVDFDVNKKVELALALEELFGVHRVDLVSLWDADPFLAANIIRGERLYARDDYLADEYELYVLRRAGDCAPLERERIALVLGEDYDPR
jgi:predicted nucleotidyltransferase